MITKILKKKKIIFSRLFLLGILISFINTTTRSGITTGRVRRADEPPAFLLSKREPNQLNASDFYTYEDYSMKEKALWNGTLICPTLGRENDASYIKLNNLFKSNIVIQENVFNIFLSETSCNSKPSYRVWCSIESMAQQNPDAHVWYVMTSEVVDASNGLVQRLLQKYPNLKLATLNLSQIFKGTPLEELYDSEAWRVDTEWPAVNLSDMIRLAIVWHFGGFYSDSDVICIAPLTSLRNVIGLQSFNLVNGATFHFEKHHPVLYAFMEYLNTNFNPYTWGMNGPQTVSAVLRNLCNGNELLQGMECGGAKILSVNAFNPIPPQAKRFLFTRTKQTNIKKRFPDTLTIHFWNRDTHSSPIVKNSHSLYDLASSAYCPCTREVATSKSPFY